MSRESEALCMCNEIRREVGLEPREALVPGMKRDNGNCCVARTLEGGKWNVTCGTSGWGFFTPSTSREVEADYKSGVFPKALSNFIKDFDNGLFPKLETSDEG